MKRLRGWCCRTSLPLLPLVLLQAVFVLIVMAILTAESSEFSDWRSVGVMRDGTLCYQRYSLEGTTQLFDLDMRPMTVSDNGGMPNEINMAMLASSSWVEGGLWAYWDARKNTNGEELWYWLEDEGYVAGYSRRTRRCIGYLGANGFASDLAAAVPFTSLRRHNRMDLGRANEGLFVFYPKTKYLRWLCRAPQFPVHDFATFATEYNGTQWMYNFSEEPDSPPSDCVVLTDSSVLVFDAAGRQKADIALPRPLRAEEGLGSVRVGMSDSNFYFLLISVDTGTIVRIAARDGRVLGDTVLPGLDGTDTRTEFPAVAAAQPGVPFIIMAVIIISGEAKQMISSGEELAGIPFRQSGLWWYAAWYLAVLAGTVWLYRRHLRHMTVPRWQKWLWAPAWFMFPFFAPFIYFGALDWPRLVKCQNCRQRRPLDRDQCPHCAAAFPRPPAKGIELIIS